MPNSNHPLRTSSRCIENGSTAIGVAPVKGKYRTVRQNVNNWRYRLVRSGGKVRPRRRNTPHLAGIDPNEIAQAKSLDQGQNVTADFTSTRLEPTSAQMAAEARSSSGRQRNNWARPPTAASPQIPRIQFTSAKEDRSIEFPSHQNSRRIFCPKPSARREPIGSRSVRFRSVALRSEYFRPSETDQIKPGRRKDTDPRTVLCATKAAGASELPATQQHPATKGRRFGISYVEAIRPRLR